MARKYRGEIVSWYQQPEPETCTLCGRVILPEHRDEHHLVPKSRGGKETLPLHRICHMQIHALFSEAELEKSYPTVSALLDHPEMQKFVAWVSRKPPGFHDGTKKSRRRREE
jgi:hypothetical protein